MHRLPIQKTKNKCSIHGIIRNNGWFKTAEIIPNTKKEYAQKYSVAK